MHIPPAWCPSCLLTIRVRKTHPRPVSELPVWGRPDTDGTHLGKQSPAQPHAGVKWGPWFPRGEPGAVISIQVLREFYYLCCYSLPKKKHYPKMFLGEETHLPSLPSAQLFSSPPAPSLPSKQQKQIPPTPIPQKSQVSFLCLFNLTQLGFLCNLVSNKPVFWCC